MRYHDIERLKLAAGRIAMGIELLTDIEDVCEYAVDKLDEPSGVHKVDNNDGTVTIHGLPVTVPSTLIPDGEVPVEVRSLCLPITSRFIAESGRVEDPVNCRTDEDPAELCIILGRKPQPVTWTPPASLANGEYKWNGSQFSKIGKDFCISKSGGVGVMFRDWTDPPKTGRYKVANGTATWLGE